MGPTSGGKTTLAEHFVQWSRNANVQVIHYDGDEVRDFFGSQHGFKPEDRMRIVNTLIHLANKAAEAGTNVIVSALTANEDARVRVRERIRDVIIVSVECSIKTCAQRDPKGLYGMAKRGEIKTLIGFNTEYLPPKNPDIVINTESLTPNNAIDTLACFLREKNRLP